MLRAPLVLAAVAFLSTPLHAQDAGPPASPVPTPAPPTAPTPSPEAAPTAAPPPARPMSAEVARTLERNVLLVAQTVMAAERMYAAANHGFFDSLRCLGAPWECIPGFSAEAAPFLDASYDSLEPRLGYARAFHPGPAATPEEIRAANASPTSLKAYAFTLTPQRTEWGLRSFCADSKGRLCARADSLEATVKNGLCDPCRKLE
jgi:hypothetical protein